MLESKGRGEIFPSRYAEGVVGCSVHMKLSGKAGYHAAKREARGIVAVN